METIYDRPDGGGIVRAPFRPRVELRGAPRPRQAFARPVPCTSDSVALGDFDGSFAVVHSVDGATR